MANCPVAHSKLTRISVPLWRCDHCKAVIKIDYADFFADERMKDLPPL